MTMNKLTDMAIETVSELFGISNKEAAENHADEVFMLVCAAMAAEG